MYMSETISTTTSFPHESSDGVITADELLQHVKENPHLYQGTLGDAAMKLTASSSAGEQGQEDGVEQLELTEVVDSVGWKRVILDTPADGVRVIFKGRSDIPQLEEDSASDYVEVSLRPLYNDEVRGTAGGIKSEQQITYAGARGSDPRLVSSPGGATQVIERALQSSEGRDVLLVCDETPQGLRTLFQAIQSLAGDAVLSDFARRLCAVEYDGVSEVSEQARDLFNELSAEMASALMSEDLSPHEALILVYRSHVGSESSRSQNTHRLREILADRLKKDILGDSSPQDYELTKNKFIDALNDPERRDYWVHRDRGILRPGSKILTGGAYVDYPRFTTHGCLNVAIDVQRNVYGSGGHGLSDAGATTVASPMAGFVQLNGMPENFEAADTFFINNQGLAIPEGTLYVTVSPDSPPEDLTTQEIWLPQEITDEDFENGNVDRIIESVINSAYISSVPESERANLGRRIIEALRSVDTSQVTESLARNILLESTIREIIYAKQLEGEGARDAAYLEHSKIGYQILDQMKAGIVINGVPFERVYDTALQEAALCAYLRQTLRMDIRLSGSESIDTIGESIVIPEVLTDPMLSDIGRNEIVKTLISSPLFQKLTEEKRQKFQQVFDDFIREQLNINEYEIGREAYDVAYKKVRAIVEHQVSSQKNLDVSNWRFRSEVDAIERKLISEAKDSFLGSREDYSDAAAVYALSGGGTEQEITARYEEFINSCKTEAKGRIISRNLKLWLTNYLVDQDRLNRECSAAMESAMAEARASRRADYLQVWLTNSFISNIRGKQTPRLESMGRGLDWDVPGQVEQRKRDAELATSFGLEVARHPDSASHSLESELGTAIDEVRKSISKHPEKTGYGRMINVFKSLPLGLVSRYIAAGMISFDQTDSFDRSEKDAFEF